MAKRIRAITFDLDDTLWWAEHVLGRADESFHDFIQENFPILAEKYDKSAFYDEMKLLQMEFPQHAHDYTFLRKKTLERCALEVEIDPECIVEKAFDAFITVRSRPVLFPETIPTLELLHQRGFVLGAITNGNFNIEYMPELKKWFTFCVSAEQVGAAKPHAAPFQQAVQFISNLIPITPEEIVHVGDSFQCDIEGAKLAGLRAIWLKHETGSTTIGSNSAADAVINNIAHVVSIVDEWNNT